MKNKILILILIAGVIFSCDVNDPNEDKFGGVNPESGWVEFNTPSNSTSLTPLSETVSIPVIINAPVQKEELVVNYEISTLSGDPASDFITSMLQSSITIPANSLTGAIEINIDTEAMANLTEQTIVQVELTSINSSDITIGLGDDSQLTTYEISSPCPINPNLNRDALTAGLGADFPPHSVTLEQTGDFEYFAEDLWGPQTVAVLTGDPSYSGQFPYPGTISIDPISYDVTVTGTSSTFPGGSGTYDSCNDVIYITLNQALFTQDFTLDVTLNVAQ